MTTFFPGELADLWLYTRDADEVLFDPDTINQIEILAPDRTVIETISSGWTNTSTGTYKYVYDMPATVQYSYIIARWKYTHNSLVDYQEEKVTIRGAGC